MFLIFLIPFTSCKQKEVDGIIIGETLFVHQNYQENQQMIELIERVLQKESDALAELAEFQCGGGAGCYDLGYIMTQIIYRIGEEEFIQLTKSFDTKTRQNLFGLIGAGLEYFDHNNDGLSDDKKVWEEFPELFEALNGKQTISAIQ